MTKEELLAQFEALDSLPYLHLYTGEPGKATQASYVRLSDVISAMSEIRRELLTHGVRDPHREIKKRKTSE